MYGTNTSQYYRTTFISRKNDVSLEVSALVYVLHSFKLCKMGYDSQIFLNKIFLTEANFPQLSRPAMGPAQPHIQGVQLKSGPILTLISLN